LINKELQHLSSGLIRWYDEHKRTLPWRNIHDPYRIWISEIILQQTRVVQGYDYYLRFIEQFPDIKSLATASEDAVLKCWQGLGYYSRARNLHAAAKQIMTLHNGRFPDNYEAILSLKGIGEYTAAAIASFAFGMPYAVVDGNVYRFLARFFGLETPIDSGNGKKEFSRLATELLDKECPDIYNQAIMEFGALQCVPTSPDCSVCPLNTGCFAFSHHRVADLPVKEKKTKITHRYFYHFLIRSGEKILLHKRTGKDIWQNLYEFPLLESTAPMELPEIMQTDFWINLLSNSNIQIVSQSKEMKHVLSHQVIHAVFYVLRTDASFSFPQELISVSQEELAQYPVSRLTEKFLETV
jgi:A/G-specific adenine glycosylase